MITIKDAYEIVMKNAIGDHAKGVGKVYDIVMNMKEIDISDII